MIKMYKACLVSLACAFLFFGGMVQAATKHAEPNVSGKVGPVNMPPLKEMGGQNVKTEYFSLVIPKGWSMPMPAKTMPLGMSALFGTVKGNLAVTVNVLKAPLTAKEVGNQTLANMRKGGLKTSELKEKNGLYYATISGKTTGICWFGADTGKGIVSAVVVLGNDGKRANELLKAIKPTIKGLFPTSAY